MSFSLFNGLFTCSASKVAAFQNSHLLAGVHSCEKSHPKRIQRLRAIKSSLATSEQAGEN